MQIIVIDIEAPGLPGRRELQVLVEALAKSKHGTLLVAPPGVSLVVLEIDDNEKHPKLMLKRDGQLYELEIEDA